MSAGVTCTLFADGERVADGSPGDYDLDPTAMSGLRLVWGRDSTVDQPEPSVLTFELADSPGGLAVKQVLTTGTRIDVQATGLTYADPTVSTFVDPGFEAAPANLTGLSNIRATARQGARKHSGAWATQLTPYGAPGHGGDPSRPASAVFAPAPFSAPGQAPGAWDAIPKTAPGQAWRIAVWVWAPVGVQVTLSQALFSGPYADAVTLYGPIVTAAGTGGWQLIQSNLVPAIWGAWAGLQVTSSPLTSWNATAGDWDAQAATTWDDLGSVWVDDIALTAPAAGIPRTVEVFSGRVTNLVSSWPDGSPTPLVTVTAADFTAELANRDVGDIPWVVETMAARVARIIALAAPLLPVTIPATLGPIPVSWRDVDSQPATGLLAELGTTVDAVMWAATHPSTGPYLNFEDPGLRPPDKVLMVLGGRIEIVDSTAGMLPVSACDLPRDAVRWTQDTSDVISRAAITWLAQGVDQDGLPTTTESTYQLIDPTREVDGTRRYGVSTQLTTQADAANVAARILGRTQLGWRADGLSIDDSDQAELTADQLLTLLDGTARNGIAVAIGDLPDWAPVPGTVGVFVEGGTYEFLDGWWVLDLTVSSAAGSGSSVRWNDPPPAWTWDQFADQVTWDSLTGVGLA